MGRPVFNGGPPRLWKRRRRQTIAARGQYCSHLPGDGCRGTKPIARLAGIGQLENSGQSACWGKMRSDKLSCYRVFCASMGWPASVSSLGDFLQKLIVVCHFLANQSGYLQWNSGGIDVEEVQRLSEFSRPRRLRRIAQY
jgi:hypothetical protein